MKRNRLLSILLAVVLVLSAFPLPTLLPVVRAVDTVPEGYIGIYTADDLYAVRNAPDANYIMMADIDLTELTAEGGDYDTGHGWTPIPNFTGVFDGNGHRIIGMRIVSPTVEAGLFSKATGATITKLTMDNVNIDAFRMSGGAIGGILQDCDISLCRVSGTIISNNTYVGGFAGLCYSYQSTIHTVSQCYNSANVSSGYAGGLFGNTARLNIVDCYNIGHVNGNMSEGLKCVGGIAGQADSHTNIVNCVNTGTITGDMSPSPNGGYYAAYVGALAGTLGSDSSCSGCYYLQGTAEKGCGGTVVDSADTCVALTAAMSLRSAFYGKLNFDDTWIMDIPSGVSHPQLRALREADDSGNSETPIVHTDPLPTGYTGIYNAEELYAVRNAPDANYIMMADIDLTELTAEGGDFDTGHGWTPIPNFTGVFDGNGHKIIGMRIASPTVDAGLFSKATGATITKLIMADVDVNTGRMTGGAICGYMQDCDISLCRVSGTITGNNTYIGGFAGLCYSYYSTSFHTVSQCYNSANVSSGYAGGLFGNTARLNIIDCYNIGHIDGNISDNIKNVGGIVGQADPHTNIINCVNVGTITGDMSPGPTGGYYATYIGALVGYQGTDSSCSGCYYLQGTAEKGCGGTIVDSADTCVALTVAMSQKQSFYSKLDFNNTWFIDCNTGILHPQLQNLPEVEVDTIIVLTDNAKLSYYQHDALDVTGLQVSVSFKGIEGAFTYPVSENMISGFSSEEIGTMTVTVTFRGKTATYDVQINPIPVSSISLNETEITLSEGTTKALRVSFTPSNATYQTITWESDDNNVATVDENGIVTAVSKGTAAITATSHNGRTAICVVTVTRPATTITLNQTSVTLYAGDTLKLNATLSPDGSTDSVTWSSNNTSAVKVSADGTLTAVKKGSATITATASSGVKATCAVTVKTKPTGVTLNYTQKTLNITESFLLTATVLPSDCEDGVTWSSSAPEIAQVTSSGRVTAKAKGFAVITAETTFGIKAECVVTVLVPATGIQLNETSLTLNVNDTAVLTATLTPSETTDTVTFTSSNSSIATVANDGTVTAKGRGTATITATATSGVSASCSVTVLVPATGIQLNKTSASVYIGNTLNLTATLTPSNSTDSITWTSSAPSVASVSSNGVVTAHTKGTAIITATAASGVSATCEITTLVPATSVTLNKTSITLNVGETDCLIATLAPQESEDTVTFTTSNSGIATVTADGTITAKGRGTATITATATGGAKATCTVTVLVPATAIQLNRTAATVYLGNTLTLTATLTPSNSTDSVLWRSSDETVVTVNQNGLVRAAGKGVADVIAYTERGIEAQCLITVPYIISYNANGGIGAPANQEKTQSVTLTLSSTRPTKSYTITYNANGGSVSPSSKTVNCTFNNWNTNQYGTGTSYAPGGSYTANADATLFAQWTNPSAGSLATPTRSGYTFEGWYTSASGGTQITDASTITGNTTIYAHWQQIITYTVSYNANGGTGTPSAQTKTHNVALTLSSTVPTKTFTLSFNAAGGQVTPASKALSCTFKNWTTGKNGGGTAYNPGGSYTANANATLYAQWTNPTAGTLPTPTRGGYDFQGWFTSASGGTQVTSASTVNGNTTLYAHWKSNRTNYNIGDETYSFANYSDSHSSGHCFGMSMTSAGYYNQWIDIDRIGGNENTSLYTFSNTAIVRKPICYYQDIQGSYRDRAMVAGGSAYKSKRNDIYTDWKEVVNYVKDHSYDNTGLLQIGFRKGNGGHAINFLRYENVNGQDRIYAYDNNFPDRETYFYKASDGNVYQTPVQTFSGSIDCICLRDINIYFSIVGDFDASHVLYVSKDTALVQGYTFTYMESDSDGVEYVMYEIPSDVSSVTIIPKVDNADFIYMDTGYSFGTITDETYGVLTFASMDEHGAETPSSFKIYDGIPPYSPGDVDGNGKVTTADARLALRRAVGLEKYEVGSAQFRACDADQDGNVTPGDARLILRAAVGLENPEKWS